MAGNNNHNEYNNKILMVCLLNDLTVNECSILMSDKKSEEKVDSDKNDSEFIGLIIDESTDVTIHKKLNVYVKCLSDNQSVIHFLDCINVIDGKAEK